MRLVVSDAVYAAAAHFFFNILLVFSVENAEISLRSGRKPSNEIYYREIVLCSPDAACDIL